MNMKMIVQHEEKKSTQSGAENTKQFLAMNKHDDSRQFE